MASCAVVLTVLVLTVITPIMAYNALSNSLDCHISKEHYVKCNGTSDSYPTCYTTWAFGEEIRGCLLMPKGEVRKQCGTNRCMAASGQLNLKFCCCVEPIATST
ncbi:hypothetical protein L596_001475 [Steinernema carpocapsae]|uniref:Activin types I and II receptor domain-containing protein n=1 Tax=Steinernema carpocapsae TaxID=34508 RepID=A0A4U8UQC9_STECR|nr:hypothetical protein L596_001475 [Steinernema carpocapsae]